MEVHHHHHHHQTRRWEGDREPFYSTESWKDHRKNALSASSWTDTPPRHSSSSASSPSALSSFLPIIRSDGSVDKVLYQNLVEMIPLVETFMEQQTASSFPRHASLVYTPSPSREALHLKKAVDHSSKGKKARGQLVRGKKGELKDSLFWDNAENMFHNNREIYSEEIPMLSFPTDHQVDQTAVNKAEILQLQSQIEQLELKLHEETHLQAAENSARQTELLQLQANIDGLQKQISEKEQEIQTAQEELSDKQYEVVGLHSLLEKAEAGVQASNTKASKVEEELNGLQCQVATLFFRMQNISKSFEDVDERESATTSCGSSVGMRTMGQTSPFQVDDLEADRVELTRRKYLAALIAAREYPSEEVLSLVAVLRAQLQAFVMRPAILNVASDLLGVQSSRFSMC